MKLATKAPFLLFLPALIIFGAEYHKPPQAVMDILNSPATPTLTLNPTHTYAMQGSPVRYPPIAELAQPMLRIAGMRINPATNGLHNVTFNSTLTLRKLPEGTEIKIMLPPNPKLSLGRWSPDGKHFVFTNTTAHAIELWVGDAATGRTHNIEGVHVNDVMGTAGAAVDAAARRRAARCNGWPTAVRCWCTPCVRIGALRRRNRWCPKVPTFRRAWAAGAAW